jgi:topoisomerase IA-like protein
MSNPGGINLNTTPYYDDYDEDKKFANISNELNIGTITFEQALELFDLPKKFLIF